MIKLVVACAGLASIVASSSSAQRRDSSKASELFARETQERWLYERQRAAFTPMTSSATSVRILGDERDTAKRTRTLSLAFPGSASGSGTARLTTDERGHIVAIVARFAPPAKLPDGLPPLADAAEELRWAIFNGVDQNVASLPETRVWDLVPTRGRTALARGSRWRDTFDLRASLGEYTQALRGVRQSTVVGDTLVRGVRLWIVRDSAVVRYEEHLVIQESTLDTPATIDRTADGTIIGRHLLDAARGLDRVRADTTALLGSAVLRYADGRSFRTPARYDRTQRVELMNAAAYRALERRRDAAHGEFSIVLRPEGDAERIARGDAKLVDALLDTVVRSRDPAARAHAIGLLRFAPDTTIAARLRAAMLRAGDTASVIQALDHSWTDRRHGVDAADFALLLPVMKDPGVAFAFGLERDPPYENARQALLANPPAITRDTSEWPCVPSVCRALAEQWSTGGDPRLRSLALIAHLTLDPKKWADTVLAHYSAGDSFLAPAVSLIRGVAASWSAGSKAAIPAIGATWRDWSTWMDGRDPAYASIGPGEPVRFQDEHRTAIEFSRVLTGRDFVAEWREGMRAATGDTARYVFGSMLSAVGAAPDDAAAIAVRLQSASPLMRSLAVGEVTRLFRAGAAAADSAVADELQSRVLAVALDDAPPWPVFDSTSRATRGASAMPRKVATAADIAYSHPAATPGPVVLRGENLAPAVRARWARRNVRIVDSTWRAKSSESVILIELSGVQVAGTFARVSITHSHLTARVNGRGQSWMSGTTLYLMRRRSDWVIVAADGWIT